MTELGRRRRVLLMLTLVIVAVIAGDVEVVGAPPSPEIHGRD